MRQYAQYELADGGRILVETDEIPDDVYRRVSAGIGEASRLTRSFSEALDAVRPAADELLRKLSSLDARPGKVEIEFGLKFSGKVGAFIASTTADANFQITLSWERKDG